MAILFSALSIICSFISIGEYWNIVNILPALILLAFSYFKIRRNGFPYAIPLIILIVKDMIWWILNVGVNFSKLATSMAISGVLKMMSDMAIIILSLLLINKDSHKVNKILVAICVCMVVRIILIAIPLIIYNGSFDNLYIDCLSLGSYAFIFAGYLYALRKE